MLTEGISKAIADLRALIDAAPIPQQPTAEGVDVGEVSDDFKSREHLFPFGLKLGSAAKFLTVHNRESQQQGWGYEAEYSQGKSYGYASRAEAALQAVRQAFSVYHDPTAELIDQVHDLEKELAHLRRAAPVEGTEPVAVAFMYFDNDGRKHLTATRTRPDSAALFPKPTAYKAAAVNQQMTTQGEAVDPWATIIAVCEALDIDPQAARSALGKPSEVILEAARKKFSGAEGAGREAVAVVGERGSVSWRSETILPVGTKLYTHPSPVADAEALKANAARYLWLRDVSVPPHNFYISVPVEFTDVRYMPAEVDKAIDQAIEARRLTGSQP